MIKSYQLVIYQYVFESRFPLYKPLFGEAFLFDRRIQKDLCAKRTENFL